MTDQKEVTTKPEAKELPEFNFKNVSQDAIDAIKALLFDPKVKAIILPILFFIELIAVKIIRANIPYTEIDYKAYMEQIAIIKSGELNYDNIYGGTGPLVYPAGHVLFYKFMNWATYGMEAVANGQQIFGYLYLLTQCIVFIIYFKLDLPPWSLYLLVLSKRLHSIYILRLFNDGFTTLFSVITVMILMSASKRKLSNKILSKLSTNVFAPIAYSIAISVKMNALLYLPGFLLITYFLNDEVLAAEIVSLSVIALVQILISYPFLYNGSEIRNAYFANAFNFERTFLYKWTVNWKFLPEEIFLSKDFHTILLIIHIGLLIFFLFTKWATFKATSKSVGTLIIDGLKIFKPTLNPNNIINDPVLGPKFVVGVLASCNFIGVLTSRSLHYQFLSWYAWSLPFLLTHSSFSFILSVGFYFIHETCWNIYPSTELSSGVLLALNIVTLTGYWFDDSLYTKKEPTKEEKDK